MKTAALAVLGILLCLNAAEARRARHVDLTPVPVAGAMVDDRYPHLRLPEAYATARVRKPARHSRRRHRQAVPMPKPRPKALVRGLVEEVRRALPTPRGLTGVVPTLAAKASRIVADCGSRVISGVRHTYVAGTRRVSLHASGKAVDLAGNPACIYRHLAGWPGGYSVDYARVRHVHVSYDPHGRREWGARFHHGGRTMSARRHWHRRR